MLPITKMWGQGLGVQGPGTAVLNRMVKESFTKMPNDQKPKRDEAK